MPFELTAEAEAEARHRVSIHDEPDPGLVVIWVPAQFDLIRGTAGEAIWKEVEPAHWLAQVMTLEHLVEIPGCMVSVGGFPVFFQPRDASKTVIISFCEGKFHVHEAEA
jgi:hypothetical protein